MKVIKQVAMGLPVLFIGYLFVSGVVFVAIMFLNAIDQSIKAL
jgi:hypothetical protein